MVDAFGNPIVMGAIYTTMSGARGKDRTHLQTGKAVSILKGVNGDKITLELIQVECLFHGGNGGLEKGYRTVQVPGSEISMGGGKLSVFPRHLFPNPKD